MGTNYYVESLPPCACCGRPFEEKHIGKSSIGWAFALHIYPDEGINTLEDWKKFLRGKKIKDEYGSSISFADLLSRITERESTRPEGLVRSSVDGVRCMGHGDGTWDYFVGEFS